MIPASSVLNATSNKVKSGCKHDELPWVLKNAIAILNMSG